MDAQTLRAHCLVYKGAVEEFPFGPEARVFKVMGKMFALIPVDDPPRISLKCEPELAVVLRETYNAVQPGYHLNKRHWNTIYAGGDLPADELLAMIDNSYALVVKGLKKAERQQLETM